MRFSHLTCSPASSCRFGTFGYLIPSLHLNFVSGRGKLIRSLFVCSSASVSPSSRFGICHCFPDLAYVDFVPRRAALFLDLSSKLVYCPTQCVRGRGVLLAYGDGHWICASSWWRDDKEDEAVIDGLTMWLLGKCEPPSGRRMVRSCVGAGTTK